MEKYDQLMSHAVGCDVVKLNDHDEIARSRAKRRDKTIKARVVTGGPRSMFAQYVVAGGFGQLVRRPRNYEVTLFDDLSDAASRIHQTVAGEWPMRAAFYTGTVYGIVCARRAGSEVRHA